ncbi:MAG: N-acetylmuramic acid 6-phosphate etherase, partial [Armatimonadota bacterium]
AVRGAIPAIATAVDLLAAGLRGGGRLIYVGAGTSGRLGVLDAAECLPTFGMSPDQVLGVIAGGSTALVRAIEGAEDDAEAVALAVDQLAVGAGDTVVGISASGGAPYVRAAVRRARERGAATIGIANVPGAPLSADADIAIEVVTGPEVIQGSTRMKAGTAQKLVCNMLTTGAMVRIGKTWGNRMVDVRATNRKLVDRARRLVRELGRVDTDEEADRLLAEAGGSVKTAIVMARRGVGAAEAERLLADAEGFVGRVVDVDQRDGSVAGRHR